MARNDITGDLIASRASNQEKYADGWDAIFGKKEKPARNLFDELNEGFDALEKNRAVMAQDFHDSTPMKGQLPDGTLYGEVEDVDG